MLTMFDLWTFSVQIRNVSPQAVTLAALSLKDRSAMYQLTDGPSQYDSHCKATTG